jgi:tetratricopeptide (TPR) repeat protein
MVSQVNLDFVFLASSTVSDSERFGQVIGAGLVLLLMVAGIIKCGLIMWRPTTSKLCVLSLLLILTSWMFSALGNVLMISFQLPRAPVQQITGAILILLMLVAFILGIVGLATYDKTRFRQGRAQAVWAVVLGAFALLATISVVAVAAFQTTKEISQAAKTRSAGKPIENKDFNFSITPSSHWAELKPAVLNKLACLALRRTAPEVLVIVVGERTAGSLELNQLLEISKSTLASASQVLQQSEETVQLNGVTFARVNTKAHLEASNQTFEYEHWLATERGYSWQIVFWTTKDRATLSAEARPIMETFRILDPALDGAGKGTLADVDRPESGYRTKLEGLGWAPWTDANGNVLMDFRAQRANEAIAVLPLRFESESPDLEAVTRGLLSSLDFDETPEEDFTENPWTPGHGGTGRELEIEREVDGIRFKYILRVARTKDSAHLVAGWAAVLNGDIDLLRRSMDAITLSAPTGTPPLLKPDRKKALGLVLNSAGISLMNRNQHEAAADWFYKGFAQGNDPTLLGNAAHVLEQANQAAKGRDLLAPHVKDFPNHRYLSLRYARLQALSGDAEAGANTFSNGIGHGLKDEDDLLDWLKLLNELEKYPSALRSVDAWVARQPSNNAIRWQAQTHAASGETGKAISILENLSGKSPDDNKVALDLGGYYNDTEEHAKAATVAERLLADGKESPRALMILGWSQMGRKWYRDAKATFERAAKKLPDDTEIQDAIQDASAALGQGDNSDVKEPILPVAIPKEIKAMLDGKEIPADFGAGYPSAWLMRATGYHFEKGKPTRRTTHRRVKILTAEGARDFSSVEAKFQPLGERIFMNRLEVKDGEGKTIAQASLNDAYVRDVEGETASNEKVLHMQVAGVQPGTTVEWEITTEDRGFSNAFEFQRHLFANGLPVAREAVFVTGDVAALRSKLDQGGELKEVRSDHLAAWVARDQSPLPSESYAVRIENRRPMLWLGGDEGSWEKIGRDYLKQIEDRLVIEKPVTELAKSLVAGKTDERDKVAAIARYVQKEIGYKAIEFGVRARRPNAGSDTLRLRYGDCKDTALFMHQLLRAAGIVSHLVLVNTDWKTQAALPTMDQFNHMVIQIPSLGQNWLVDATDKSLALELFPADGLWHSHGLVLDTAKPHLIEPSAPAPPDSAVVKSHRTVTVDGHNWNVEETLELTGYYASWMRGAFTGLSPTEQRDKAQRILSEQGAAQVHEFRFENLDDVGKPARLVQKYTVRDALTLTDGRQSGALPALWERDYLGTSFVKDRKTDFEWIYPLHVTAEVIAKLLSPLTAGSLDSLAKKSQSDFCSWSLKPEIRGNEVILKFDFVANPGTHPAARYASFHEAWDTARRAWDKPLSWDKPRS